MARTATGDRAELEAAIGPRGSTKITSENRNDVRRWLRARGCPSEIAQALSVAVLDKAYNDESSFDELTKVLDQVQQQQAPYRTEEPAPMPTPQPNPFAKSSQQPRTYKPNRFPGHCEACSEPVDAFAGVLVKENGGNAVYCAVHAPSDAFPPKIEPNTPPFQPIPENKPEQAPQHKTQQHSDDPAAMIAKAIAAIAGQQQTPLDEKRVLELIAQHITQPTITENVITITAPSHEGAPVTLDPSVSRHAVFPSVLRKIAAGVHVYLVGPAGSGKSTIAEQCADALKRKLYTTNAVQSPFALTGYMDATGNYRRSTFRDAYELGGLFLFDEMDSSSADALTTFNGALAQSFFAFPDGMVSRHADFVCIAAANTIGKGADRLYVGRQQLDAATLDRYAFITMDYDEAFERKIASNADWTKYVQAVRKACADLKIRHVVSPRASISGGKLLAAGDTWEEVAEAVIWKGLDADSRAKITAALPVTLRRVA